MKVIIVGGVAGGASCAARLRRLDEKAEIVMVERGPYVSYANCGLPYHVSGVIEKESSLLVASEQMFRATFAIDARTNCEAIAHRSEGEDRATAQRHHRRGDDRVVRQARALARRGVGAAAAARHRPAGDLPGADGAGRAHDPRVDRARHRVPGGHVQLLGDAVRQAGATRGGDRRRLHRPGDGGEPGPRRVRGHAGRDARPGARPDGPGDRAPRRGTPEEARRATRRSATAWPASSHSTAARSRCRRSPARPTRRTS